MHHDLRRRLLLAGCAVLAGPWAGMSGARAQAVDASAGTDQSRAAKGSAPSIVVTGIRQGAAYSHATEESLANIVSVRTADEIRKLPDVNAAEAVARIPGVSVVVDTGEGRYVNIRGMDPDLNSTSYGGVRMMPAMPSQGGANRAVALDTIPVGLLNQINVTKTTRPDGDSEALGGTIDLVPRSQTPNGDAFMLLDVGGGFENLRHTALSHGSVVMGGSFGLGKGKGPLDHPGWGDGWLSNPRPFSIVATAGWWNDRRGIDDSEFSLANNPALPGWYPSSVQLRRYQMARKRLFMGGEIAFDPNPDNHFYARFIQSGYHERVNRQRLDISGLDSGSAACPNTYCTNAAGQYFADSMSSDIQRRDMEDELTNQILTIGSDHKFGRGRIDWHFGWVTAREDIKFDRDPVFGSNSSFSGLVGLVQGNAPVVTNTSANISDPAFYTLNDWSNSPSTQHDSEYSAGLNIQLPLDLLTHDDSIKFGALARWRKRFYKQGFADYVPAPGVNIPATNYTSGPNLYTFGGLYDFGPALGTGANQLVGTPALVRSNPQADYLTNWAAAQQNHENVYAGYAQYEGTFFEKLHVLAGVRVEGTQGHYLGNVTTIDTNNNPVYASQVTRKDYVNVFPSLHLRYQIAPLLLGRLSYSTALARPGFNQLNPGTTVNFTGGTNGAAAVLVTTGNPSLKPVTGDSFDASVEYYGLHGEKLSIGAFDKQFHNYIVPASYLVQNDMVYGHGQVTQYVSYLAINSAQLYGFEAEWSQRFFFLPSILQNFGIDANFTYIHSRAMIHPGSDTSLPGTSPKIFNAALFYEGSAFTARVAANYTGRELVTLGRSAASDTYYQGRWSLDYGMTYTFAKHYTLYFDAKNLLNTPLIWTQTPDPAMITRHEQYLQTFMGGVRVSF